ncbi:MAG: VIT and VWA domain-containing protein [Anaeromyxobacter sp.]
MDTASSGGRLVTADGRALPLRGVTLTSSAKGGLARTVLAQRFHNPFPEPLQVQYLFPLPHDGAVSGFAFTIGDRRVVGEVDRRAAARERFEEALASGRTAALLDQERGSVFTQSLGNVPPGAEVVAELTVDQRLSWRPDGSWEWRFPSALAPRHQGQAGRVTDAARVTVDVADGPLPVRLALSLHIEDAVAADGAPESPSHPLQTRSAAGALEVTLADGPAPLDRDLVVRWPVAAPEVGLSLDTFRAAAGPLAADAFGLLTLVPPARGAAKARFGRDLVVLLDTSGSMSGEPLAQAVRVVSALVETLEAADTLELIEFSDAPRRWRRKPVSASAAERKSALAWLAKLRASGSTEMHEALREALAGLRPDAQRQLVLVTDGHIGFEQEIVAELSAHLPAGSRLHTLGVGSSVNRSLLGPAARAGRGTESIVGLGEDVERAIHLLVSRTAAPLLTGLAVVGDAVVEHAPARLPDLFGGAPALLPVRLRPEGGTLRVTGRLPGGAFERVLHVPPVAGGTGQPALAALFGREAVEDLEVALAAGQGQAEIDAAVERLGLAHQLSTRLTSWIAVTEEATVDPTAPTRRVRQPQQLPHGMSVEGLGLRAASGGPPLILCEKAPMMAHDLGVQAAPAVATITLYQGPVAGGPPAPSPAKAKRVERRTAAADARPPDEVRREIELEEEGQAEPGPRHARVTLDRDGKLVLELDLDAPLDWERPEEVVLVLRDGTRLTARVDPARTTARGELAAGVTLRLALTHDRGPLGEALVEVVLDDGLRLTVAQPR